MWGFFIATIQNINAVDPPNDNIKSIKLSCWFSITENLKSVR